MVAAPFGFVARRGIWRLRSPLPEPSIGGPLATEIDGRGLVCIAPERSKHMSLVIHQYAFGGPETVTSSRRTSVTRVPARYACISVRSL
jgi:hypothetical protein